MIRYWIKFNFENYAPIPSGTIIGCGVTALDYEDALNIINDKLFKNNSMAPIENLIENVDISTLDAGHILPNMGLPNVRGIWFPLGYN
ncbi:hypothetical protein ABIE26_001888 [Pedobacter africanus]|uniref:Uncharacterized protein n=1 Tax=Pedobacter africanus TaxID=151894 RepID=A0ACC6KQT8_9SPHI|nr:hypothetical protein [Pedobacter africanus]MDR6781624.1 hypothetical protein [Pedobacter africanus]